MPHKSEVVKRFLEAKAHPDLAGRYNLGMEVQVNVAQDDGEPIQGDYRGRKWRGYTNGLETWKPFRVPWNANTEPEYTDSEIKFNFESHVEAIGMTGWDWENQLSRWVAYDFDSITTHKDGLTQEVLNEVVDSVKEIDWVSVRKSTSGSGIHLYVYLQPIETANHTEHAALSRAILGKLSAMTGFDFAAKVDTCGGNMWIWHRKMEGTDGLDIVSEGRDLLISEVPNNWRDHLKVIKSKNRSRNADAGTVEYLASQRSHEVLDEEHRRLFEYFEQEKALWWWDQDMRMLVTHTGWLERAFEALSLKGVYKTTSASTNLGEQNAFCFPMKHGAWAVRRYTRGIAEAETWDQDGQGWTRCYFNQDPDIKSVAAMYEGVEDKKGNFVFREAESAIKALGELGVHFDVPVALNGRQVTVGKHKDENRLSVDIKREPNDSPIPGWSVEKNSWYKAFYVQSATSNKEPEMADFDDMIRHLVTKMGEDYGWTIHTDGHWRTEPLTHLGKALKSLGHKGGEVDKIIGSAVMRPWTKVNKPLQPEYPGNREWNRNAAQLAFTPSDDLDNLSYPTWLKMLKHCGSGLDEAVIADSWCKVNGLKTGGDYLKCWVAGLLQSPMVPLPYLFFYGVQNSGKSIFHEAITELLTAGCKRADAALVSQSNFNAELEDAILCIVEETDLEKNKNAYNRIKDWVTSRTIMIHCKGMTPYQVPNTTHWVQMANERSACPVFPGDTRITMCHVEPLDPLDLIPKDEMINRLKKEAPAFLAEILHLEIPRSNDRLRVPVVSTGDKENASISNMNSAQVFLSERCYCVPGKVIKYSELFARFKEFLDTAESDSWTQRRFGEHLEAKYPKGRQHGSDASWYIGNISFEPAEGEPLPQLVAVAEGRGTYLVPRSKS